MGQNKYEYHLPNFIQTSTIHVIPDKSTIDEKEQKHTNDHLEQIIKGQTHTAHLRKHKTTI